MSLNSIPALFMRGGTSKALMLRLSDLPTDRTQWAPLFLSAMGSPDPYGRQLDGMGGGVSSLSKVCIIGPSIREDADVDYTFAQVMVSEAHVDYSINCGNMSSAVGPFAVHRGMLKAHEGENRIRIYNTNTNKIIVATFEVRDGVPLERGNLSIPGVSGSGAPIRLDFLQPGGATTGNLLPGGVVSQMLEVAGIGMIEVSLVDAANACVFVAAKSLGASGIELPDDIERNQELMMKLGAVRAAGAVAMGLSTSIEDAEKRKSAPFIAMVSPARQAKTLSGDALPASAADLTVRVISSGQPHRALPLTISLCTAVAAQIQGSVVQRAVSAGYRQGAALRLGMPSGVLTVGAEVNNASGHWHAEYGSFFRTARRLFDGQTYF